MIRYETWSTPLLVIELVNGEYSYQQNTYYYKPTDDSKKKDGDDKNT